MTDTNVSRCAYQEMALDMHLACKVSVNRDLITASLQRMHNRVCDWVRRARLKVIKCTNIQGHPRQVYRQTHGPIIGGTEVFFAMPACEVLLDQASFLGTGGNSSKWGTDLVSARMVCISNGASKFVLFLRSAFSG